MSTTTAEPAAAKQAGGDKHGKYLTFKLDDNEFGVPILRVREIIAKLPITPVPDAPHSIRGVVNLRGRVIPVMDLRRRFDLGGDSADFERACIVVIEADTESGLADLGLLVDAVQEVFTLNDDSGAEKDDYSATIDSGCIAGIARDASGIKVLIDIDRQLSTSRLGAADLTDAFGSLESQD